MLRKWYQIVDELKPTAFNRFISNRKCFQIFTLLTYQSFWIQINAIYGIGLEPPFSNKMKIYPWIIIYLNHPSIVRLCLPKTGRKSNQLYFNIKKIRVITISILYNGFTSASKSNLHRYSRRDPNRHQIKISNLNKKNRII